ncbi:MAG: sigma-54 dependent transcriptional regulator [Syntrophobacteraceae bacterium]|nr:sigma-54 dependent transcriptional regulator [Syntrophobacteraceae bacterium]
MEKILIVDDEDFIRENLERILKEERYRTAIAKNGEEALSFLKEASFDLVFLDLRLPDISGIEILKKIKESDPDLLVIVMTGYASVESAVEALKSGAYDYIKKPFKADVIKLIVRLALEAQSLKREILSLKKQREGARGNRPVIISKSLAMKEVLIQVREVAKHAETTVLITGETGTGKDLAARAIHDLSSRANRPFIEVNCATLPANLLESELFGHETGAFTGARGRKIGLFEAASTGTIFLDEIGEMELGLQAKLLRVLEDKKIRRLGGTQLHEIDVRIIAASNQDLREAIKAGRFREDLFYRLHIVPIHMPPLRARPQDILALSNHFLSEYAKKFSRNFEGLSREAEVLLQSYCWPGNVRELRHVVERICIMHDAKVLGPEHLPKELTPQVCDTTLAADPMHFPLPPGGFKLDEMIERFTLHLVVEVMQRAEGNISKAAKLLGIPRGTLRYKLDKFSLEGYPGEKKPISSL